jgi:hypothetical protein
MKHRSTSASLPLPGDWEEQFPTHRGHWFRKGDRIIVALTNQSSADDRGGQLGEVPTIPSSGPVTTADQIADALRRGSWELAIQSAIRGGVQDENRLTDMVFNARHPERQGRRLQPNEQSLIKEWLDIRERLVRPALRNAPARMPTVTGTASGQPPTRDANVALTQSIARARVPGMPGMTLQELIEKWRQQIAGEIPISLLLAFIRFESGGNFDNATHASGGGFYELGLFQTPGGSYGSCTGRGELWRKQPWHCSYDPPGRENPNDASEWYRLCRTIHADPNDWLNPTTQIRVGLLNLAQSGARRRMKFPGLFPRVGSDWYLRMAVLMPFAGGAGYSDKFLSPYSAQLAALAEDRRWEFMRGKLRSDFVRNVDEKMTLAGKLGYRPQPF